MAVRAFAVAAARRGAPRFVAPLRAPAAGLFSKARLFSSYSTKVVGEVGSPEYRLKFQDASGKDISPWHDVPLETGEPGVFNCIIEIPKMTKPKMEISTKEAANPISQDMKKGVLRDYHGPIFWNYGYLPQTWEDPNVEHPELKVFGDNDPVDVVEIGSRTQAEGEVTKVKVLGTLAMIDDGELDWKLIAISADDPAAKDLQTIADVEAKMPGVVSGIREWFRWYKTPDNKPINAFGFDEKALDKKMALEVVEETNHAWKSLMAGKTDKGKLWLK
mmetsp:Transcript_1912/g.5624  ORF Transcript_1912/g.5624 Transcript_1912/m.5624 type:complete len:275 (+) Transcript_1912:59-883(+)